MLGVSCLPGFLILTNTQAGIYPCVFLPVSHQVWYNRRKCSMKNSQGLANLWSAVYSPGFLLSFAVKDCYTEK